MTAIFDAPLAGIPNQFKAGHHFAAITSKSQKIIDPNVYLVGFIISITQNYVKRTFCNQSTYIKRNCIHMNWNYSFLLVNILTLFIHSLYLLDNRKVKM